VRPRGPFAWIASGNPEGRIQEAALVSQLGLRAPQELCRGIQESRRSVTLHAPAVVPFGSAPQVDCLSVRRALAGKNLLLIGVTGFIGKVWMVDLLEQIPDIGKITLLIRRNRTTTAQRRFEKIVEESPTLDGLQKQYGARLGEFLRQKIDVVEGDVSVSGLGLEASVRTRLQQSLHLVVNSAGLTDFNPDLRDAISSNVESAEHLLNFIRSSDHAALMHLSTCYVVGMRDGRVTENLHDNYSPANVRNFDAEREIASLRETMQHIEDRSESPELARALRRQALGRGADETRVAAGELDGVLKRNRSRWVRNKLVRVGMRRAQHLGWPNTYTFTKALANPFSRAMATIFPSRLFVHPSSKARSTRHSAGGMKVSTLPARSPICSAQIFANCLRTQKNVSTSFPWTWSAAA
jgi:long-chain acyl-CoA synthetase